MYNQYEKNYRLAVAYLIKRLRVDRLMSTEESKKETGKKSLYHNRLPSTRPKCVGDGVEQHRPITIMQDNASSHTAAESIAEMRENRLRTVRIFYNYYY